MVPTPSGYRTLFPWPVSRYIVNEPSRADSVARYLNEPSRAGSLSNPTETSVIEDFYRGSNDSAFVRAILYKASTTSEQLFREADLYITADEQAQDLIGGAKPAPPAPRRDANQQPDKHWEKRPREEVHAAGPPVSRARVAPRGGERTLDDILDAQCPYHKDMRHTLRNYRDFKHSVGNGRPF
jgi:hypothetical protein